MDLAARMQEAIPVIENAGEIIMKYYHAEKNVQYKGEIDLVTSADKDSERFLFEQLSARFPEDGILAEEGHNRPSQNGYTWVIDPLDGTTSFAHRFPMFAVSAGLVDSDNNPVLGIVHNPYYKETFHAFKNGGAFLNSKPIQVSSAQGLDHSLIGTGFPYSRRTHMEEILERLGRVLHKAHDVRRTGSASIDLAFVASGRLDGYYETGLKPWDVAAGLIIVQEAGGRCSLFNLQEIDIEIPETLVTNGKIHVELSEIM